VIKRADVILISIRCRGLVGSIVESCSDVDLSDSSDSDDGSIDGSVLDGEFLTYSTVFCMCLLGVKPSDNILSFPLGPSYSCKYHLVFSPV
jgi:hypothetical protein